MSDKTTDTTADNTANAPATGEFEQIELDSPIQRGSKSVATVTLRKPRSGELRGVALTDLLQMDVNALTRIVPRISEPVITDKEVATLDPADLVQIGSAVAGFLLTRRAKQDNAA